ncbi:MAG: hypothetical protein Q8N82_08405 [Deltaproteobacteria bacterium]|nr:hypothetical protein [Deltaproteobacteria bacterium]
MKFIFYIEVKVNSFLSIRLPDAFGNETVICLRRTEDNENPVCFFLKAIKITINQEENLWMICPNEQIDCLRRRY